MGRSEKKLLTHIRFSSPNEFLTNQNIFQAFNFRFHSSKKNRHLIRDESFCAFVCVQVCVCVCVCVRERGSEYVCARGCVSMNVSECFSVNENEGLCVCMSVQERGGEGLPNQQTEKMITLVSEDRCRR